MENIISLDKNTLVYIERNDSNKNQKFYNNEEDLGSVYKRIFKCDYKRRKWACGKIISVSRENIHNTPVSIYENMLNFVLEPHDGSEPSQEIYRTRCIYIERILLEAFHPKKIEIRFALTHLTQLVNNNLLSEMRSNEKTLSHDKKIKSATKKTKLQQIVITRLKLAKVVYHANDKVRSQEEIEAKAKAKAAYLIRKANGIRAY